MGYVFSAVRFRVMNPLKRAAGLNVPLGNGLCLGRNVLVRHGWKAFSICEDWELYAMFTHLGVTITSATPARIYSQEARSLKQSSSQRQRWTAGKMAVLRDQIGPILRSRHIGIHQKLDAVAELTSLGPAVHLGLAIVLAFASLVLPGGVWLAAFIAASLIRPIMYTAIAVRLDPEPLRAFLAFGYLPFYTVWRLSVQALSFKALGNSRWVRTERHAATGIESV
jgi:cellulose synthase/poly-beta-1,6-N-acetylglucosamine synthase-like glycosyltransferase